MFRESPPLESRAYQGHDASLQSRASNCEVGKYSSRGFTHSIVVLYVCIRSVDGCVAGILLIQDSDEISRFSNENEKKYVVRDGETAFFSTMLIKF